MAYQDFDGGENYPLALIAGDLIIIPTPITIHSNSYRAFYASLHRNEEFCQMGFGEHFPAVDWSDEDTYNVIGGWDVSVSWKTRGMGDFAVGTLPGSPSSTAESWARDAFGLDIMIDDLSFKSHDGKTVKAQIVKTGVGAVREVVRLAREKIDSLHWVGYTGVREATEENLRGENPDSNLPPLPHWLERIEIRYGVSPAEWGKGIAIRATSAVVEWAAAYRDVRMFIAETERDNSRSGRILQRLGFTTLAENKYWRQASQIEWERPAVLDG